MAGYNDQYHQVVAMQRLLQSGIELQVVRERNVGQVLLIAAFLLQAFDMLRVVTPQPDIQPGACQMDRQCCTP